MLFWICQMQILVTLKTQGWSPAPVVKAIIEELNRKVDAIEGGKQTLNRLESYLEILVKNKQ